MEKSLQPEAASRGASTRTYCTVVRTVGCEELGSRESTTRLYLRPIIMSLILGGRKRSRPGTTVTREWLTE
ncbi:hypothetical protein E4U43_006001, partial [Claviceps pusilla]